MFAGVKGWRNRPLMRELENTQCAGGAIRWLGEVADDDLAALYRGAQFTVYPSLTEGWGLPVQESLAFGVPCIASKAGAIPEAGRDLAVYVDPTDDAEVSEAIDRYLTDQTVLAAARSRIATFLASGRLATWNDAARQVLDAAERSLSVRAAQDRLLPHRQPDLPAGAQCPVRGNRRRDRPGAVEQALRLEPRQLLAAGDLWLSPIRLRTQPMARLRPDLRADRRLLCPLLRPELATLPALARRHGARLIETPDVNSAATRAAVQTYAPDFIVVMNFDQILKPPLIALAEVAAVNVHPALLPALRGPCPELWAVARKLGVSGATVHVIEDQTIDAGRVLARIVVPIDRAPSVGELNTRLFLAGARALPAALARLEADKAAGEPQNLSAGEYLGYPTAAEMAGFRRAGLRLCRAGHAIRLIAAALGVARWKDHG